MVTAVARVALPEGRMFREGDADTTARFERFLSGLPPASQTAMRGILWSLGVAAFAGKRRNLDALTDGDLEQLIERWRTGSYPQRMAMKILTAPLKLAHFNDRAMYESVGAIHALPVAKPDQPRYVTERTIRAAELPDGETVECDVVVIGTGAGGAVVARELVEQGHAVVLLEEGEYHTRADFTGHAADAQQKLYRDFGATVTIGNTNIPVPIGMTVGGTTTVNSGTCYRFPDRIGEHWKNEFGLDELTADKLAPHYERVEKVLGVAPNAAKHTGKLGEIIARGCDHLGWKHAPIPRNAPDCDGQGVCCFGCPTDAKRSMNVSYVPMALKEGAQLYTGIRADEILIENGRAVGVVGTAKGGKRLTVRARAVVVACGSLISPLLLEKNGIGMASGQLGRNLTIHPAAGMMALFDEQINGARSVPQGYSIEEFHDEGILFEGAFMPLDVGAASIPYVGRTLVELLESYDRIHSFGFLIEDTSSGRVRLGPGGSRLITYWLNDHDVARIKRGAELLMRCYLAAGARRLYPCVNGFDTIDNMAELEAFRRAKLTARDFELTAYHPLGTVRMGRDPSKSVVNPDHQVHDVPGLYVVDGSVLPSSPAVNPQLTIMALATRAAEKIGRRLG